MKKIAFLIISIIVVMGVIGCEDLTGITFPKGITSTSSTDTATGTMPQTTTTAAVSDTTISSLSSDLTTTGAVTTAPASSGSDTTAQPTSVPPTTLVTTEPATTVLTTAPATTVSVTTAPETTASVTTAPVTTAPPTTATPTTEPMTTLPVTTTETTTETTTTVNYRVVSFYVDEQLYHEENVIVGYSISAPENPSKGGFVFLGWVLQGGSAIETFPQEVHGNLVFVASFEEEETLLNHFFVRLKTETPESLVLEVVLGGDEIKINGYDVRLNYNVEYLTYQSHVNNVANVTNPNDPGVILFNYSDIMTAFTNETVLLTVTFDIVKSGSSQISLTVIEATVVDESFNINVATTNASGLIVDIS